MALLPVRSSLFALLALLAIATPVVAQDQQSARDLFDVGQANLGPGERPELWSQWQYETAPISTAADLDFSLSWGYVDATHTPAGDVFVVAIRNHSAQVYCIRPKLKFTGKLSQERKTTGSVLLPANGVLMIASMRVARRTKVVHDIDSAFWPAPPGRDPNRCSAREPAGLRAWLDAPGPKPFPGNRIAMPPKPAG